jgi:urea-proton symporter
VWCKYKENSFLKNAAQFSYKYAIALTFTLVIVWPLPLYFSGYVFDLPFYGLWVGIAVVWVSVAAFFIIGLPVIQARHGIKQIITGKKIVVEETEEVRRAKRAGDEGI